MSDNLISSSGLKLRISDELAKRSELNNLAKSSVVSQIIDSVVEPMADNINTTTMAINSVYTDLAAGAYLTANAYDFGVISNIYSNVYLSDDDQVVSLSMFDGSAFPDYLNGRIVIPIGTEYNINEATTVEVTRNVYVTPGNFSMYIPVKVTSTGVANIEIDTKIRIGDSNNQLSLGLAITFKENVNFGLVQESDESLRQRAQLAKIKIHGSSDSSISGWISGISTILDHKLNYNISTNMYEIYVVTSNYISNGVDPNVNSIVSSLRNKLDYYSGVQSKFEIKLPEIYKLSFIYSKNNVTEDVANAIFEDIFSKYYKFSETEELSSYDIQSYMPGYNASINISKMIVYSDTYGFMDVEDDTYFKIPEGSLIVFDVDGMILEEE